VSNTWQALGTPHADGIPLLNKRPVWVGSLAEISPVTTIGPAAHGVGVGLPPPLTVAVAVRVAVFVGTGTVTVGVVGPQEA
jgi:hypothetical protein